MSASNASIVFNKTVPVLAHLLKTLIYMPEPSNITRILPIPFTLVVHWKRQRAMLCSATISYGL